MAKHGGARPGSGRPKGSPNVKTAEILAKALEEGQTPVEYMLEMMRDQDADPKDRAWAAEKSAPYVHPRPSPTPRTIEIDLPDIGTVDGIKEAIETVAKGASEGKLAPSEAQSLIAVVEAQRKVIETTEIIERIERLEAKHQGRA